MEPLGICMGEPKLCFWYSLGVPLLLLIASESGIVCTSVLRFGVCQTERCPGLSGGMEGAVAPWGPGVDRDKTWARQNQVTEVVSKWTLVVSVSSWSLSSRSCCESLNMHLCGGEEERWETENEEEEAGEDRASLTTLLIWCCPF